MSRRRLIVPVVLALAGAGLAGCGSQQAAVPKPRPGVEQAWIRTTDGAKNTAMTAFFADLSNPTDAELRLDSASCPVAGVTEIHEMANVDGRMVMRKAQGGVAILPGKHVHLKPGGYHVMLMQLSKPLPVGDEAECTLRFSDGTEVVTKAMVKAYTEEEDHYHEGDPTPGAMRS